MENKYTIINKKEKKKALLIHGLFANSGYWLEYLTFLKDFKLIIVDIDYFRHKTFHNIIDEINLLISKELDGIVDIIISHSLGTIIANGVSESIFKYSFEICPLHSSTKIGRDSFIQEIYEKLRHKMTYENIKNKLKFIDNVISQYPLTMNYSNQRIFFFPDNDKFFKYDTNIDFQIHHFKGDHFNIKNTFNIMTNFL